MRTEFVCSGDAAPRLAVRSPCVPLTNTDSTQTRTSKAKPVISPMTQCVACTALLRRSCARTLAPTCPNSSPRGPLTGALSLHNFEVAYFIHRKKPTTDRNYRPTTLRPLYQKYLFFQNYHGKQKSHRLLVVNHTPPTPSLTQSAGRGFPLKRDLRQNARMGPQPLRLRHCRVSVSNEYCGVV